MESRALWHERPPHDPAADSADSSPRQTGPRPAPEYNGFITPLLKNTLDWASRPVPGVRGQSGLTFMKGKVAGLVSASPGSYGGIRSLGLARQYLTNLGFLVVPEQVAIGGAATAFGEDGDMKDDRLRTAVLAVGVRVAHVAAALATTRRAV